MNTVLRTSVLVAIALLPVVSWAAGEAQAAAKPDPFTDAVLDCHSAYATSYTSIANTAASIADRAELRCKKEWDAYERSALAAALATVADPAGAAALEARLITDFRKTAREFTIEVAIIYGATTD